MVEWKIKKPIIIALGVLAALGVFIVALVVLIMNWSNILFYIHERKINNLPKIKSSPVEWDNIPITHFHVRTSHNSFIGSSIQVFSQSSSKSILNALKLGARAIEIDVGLDNSGKCVVGHKGLRPGEFSTTTVSFESMLQLIADNAFKDVNDPLFICLDNTSDSGNRVLGERMYEGITNILGKYLHVYSKGLRETPLKELRNKIVILGTENPYGPLNKITHSYENKGSLNENALTMRTNWYMTRIWPQEWNSVLSHNFNAIPFMKNNNRMIAMNFGHYDSYLLTYLKQFGEHGLAPVPPEMVNY